MARKKSLRREIYEAGCMAAIGRIPEPGEHEPVERRMNERFYGSGQADLSFYAEPDYMLLALNSWTVASQYDVQKVCDLGLVRNPVGAFFDYCGGIGMTACYLATRYPDATVYTHNMDAAQRGVAELLRDSLGLTNVYVTDELHRADMLICQETLEHFRDPFGELRRLLVEVYPDQYLDGSSFTFDSPGHFNPYVDGKLVVERKKAKRHLNRLLHSRGFVRPWEDPKTGVRKLFNQRPALWSRPL